MALVGDGIVYIDVVKVSSESDAPAEKITFTDFVAFSRWAGNKLNSLMNAQCVTDKDKTKYWLVRYDVIPFL